MLEQYFKKPQTVDRIRGSWLGEPVERYVVWLSQNGYAARNVERRVPMLMHFAAFDQLPGLVDAFVDHWVRTRRRHGRTKEAKRHIAGAARVPVVQMLALLVPGYRYRFHEPLATPFAESAPGFFDYLRNERGLKELSVALYEHNLRRFQAYLERVGLHELEVRIPVETDHPFHAKPITDSIPNRSPVPQQTAQ